MFHFVTGVYDSVFKTEQYKLLVVGLDGSGKTAVLERLRYHEKHRQEEEKKKSQSSAPQDGFASISAGLKASPPLGAKSSGSQGSPPQRQTPLNLELIKPTIGLNIARLNVLSHNLLVWDMGGKEALRPLWWNYSHQCHALVFVVDASDESRFAEVRAVARQLLTHPTLSRVPILVVLNKMDKLIDREGILQGGGGGGVDESSSSTTATTTTHLAPPSAKGGPSPSQHSHSTVVSTANLIERIGLLDVAIDALEEQDRLKAQLRKQKQAAGTKAGGDEEEEGLSATVDVPPGLTHTMGVGDRLFRVLPASALYEEELVTQGGSGGGGCNQQALSVEVERLSVGMEWLVRYLEPNARHVESL